MQRLRRYLQVSMDDIFLRKQPKLKGTLDMGLNRDINTAMHKYYYTYLYINR